MLSDKDRERLERKLSREMAGLLAGQRGRIVDLAELDYNLIDDNFWLRERDVLAPVLISIIARIVTRAGQSTAEDVGVGIDEGILQDRAVAFARDYSFNLITGLNTTSRSIVSRAVQQAFTTPGFTLQDFVDVVSPTFGPTRAEMIGITEVTRAASQGVIESGNQLRQLGVQLDEYWLTNRDDRVCPICAPRHNKKRGDGWDDPPPAHPRCRCDTALRIPRG